MQARASMRPWPPTWLAGVNSATSPASSKLAKPARLPISRKLPGSRRTSIRSRQVSLRRLRWRTTPGSFEPGARRLWAIACRAATLSSIGAQLSSAVTGGAARAAPAAGLHLAALAHLDVDDRARMRAFDGLVPGWHRQRTGRRRGRGASPATESGNLLVEELQRPRLRLRRVDRLGEQGGARIARPEVGMRQDGVQLVGVGRHTGDMELVERAGEAIDRRFERARGTGLADQLGQQGVELRRRR